MTGAIKEGKFVLGEVSFPVNQEFRDDRKKYIQGNFGAIDKLDTAVTKAFGKALGLEVEPFSKGHLRAPLMGALQIALMQDLDGEVLQTVLEAQEGRLKTYSLEQEARKNGVQDFIINPRPKAAKKADGTPAEPRKANLYRLVAATKGGDDGWDNQQNQKFSIIEGFIRLGAVPGGPGVSVAKLSASIDANPIRGIKTPSKVNVSFYVNQFSKADMNFIEQVDEQGNVVVEEPAAPKAPKPAATPAPKASPAKPQHQTSKKK
jgi:hypothetical protein